MIPALTLLNRRLGEVLIPWTVADQPRILELIKEHRSWTLNDLAELGVVDQVRVVLGVGVWLHYWHRLGKRELGIPWGE